MTFIRESEIRLRARNRASTEGYDVLETLNRAANIRQTRYDIFLSQTIRDAEIVLGVYDLLTEKGYVVFCDWIEAPDVDRGQVSPANAEFVRQTMKASDTLLFLDTDSANQSLWMSWEIGWFDGNKGPVGVLPVLSDSQLHYRGREFLGLYPYVELGANGDIKLVRPVVTDPSGIAIIEAPNSRSFDSWRSGPRDYLRPSVTGPWR